MQDVAPRLPAAKFVTIDGQKALPVALEQRLLAAWEGDHDHGPYSAHSEIGPEIRLPEVVSGPTYE